MRQISASVSFAPNVTLRTRRLATSSILAAWHIARILCANRSSQSTRRSTTCGLLSMVRSAWMPRYRSLVNECGTTSQATFTI